MSGGVVLQNQQLRDRLSLLLEQSYRRQGSDLSAVAHTAREALQADRSGPLDLVITHNEVNRRHGTGVLLKNMFAGQQRFISIRARDDYNADHDFGLTSFCLPRPDPSRAEMFRALSEWLEGLTVQRILCVPYYADSALAGVAAKDMLGAPLCTYVMDDANIYSDGIPDRIPDRLMKELLDNSDLRLAISPELRVAYEMKYRRKFWLLPPTVEPALITTSCNLPPPPDPRRGVLIGNIWAQRWLDRLVETVKDSGVTIDWYCNSGNAPGWLQVDEQALAAAGIALYAPLPERELAFALRGYAFAILPSGSLDGGVEHRAIAQLSLPTRVPFIVATSNVPIIVLGNPHTAAARFIRRFDVGVCCDYDGAELRRAVAEVTDGARGMAIRANAFRCGRSFSSAGIVDWLWDSLERREAADARFEALMSQSSSEFAYYVSAEPPEDIYPDYAPVYLALERLTTMGYAPDFVLDVGASNGVWSHFARRPFPQARFILVEPLASRYKAETTDYFLRAHPEFEVVEVALSDRAGTMPLRLSANLYGSSLLDAPMLDPTETTIDVPVTTLDDLAEDKRIAGRGLLKLDVQYAEHLVLMGGTRLLDQVDVVVMELSLGQVPDGARNFLDMANFMNGLGFRYFDDGGEWRSAVDGMLEQKDVLFVRKELFR
jgi:FkbM family methyltransferase